MYTMIVYKIEFGTILALYTKQLTYTNKNTNIMKELYRDIEGYEGLYQVSNLGNVKSLSRQTGIKGIRPSRLIRERVLKPNTSVKGYHRAFLRKDGNVSYIYYHRLVFGAFGESCMIGLDINHKDLDKSNNSIVNLEAVTHAENMAHARALGVWDVNKIVKKQTK